MDYNKKNDCLKIVFVVQVEMTGYAIYVIHYKFQNISKHVP